MGWKLVELQVALPRTQDVGKMQEMLQQRSQINQDQLAALQQKEVEQKSKQVNKYDEAKHKKLQKEDHHTNQRFHDNQKRKQKRQNKEQHDSLHHPYKGKILDIEG